MSGAHCRLRRDLGWILQGGGAQQSDCPACAQSSHHWSRLPGGRPLAGRGQETSEPHGDSSCLVLQLFFFFFFSASQGPDIPAPPPTPTARATSFRPGAESVNPGAFRTSPPVFPSPSPPPQLPARLPPKVPKKERCKVWSR